MKKRHFYEAVATLVGTIIGAGVLGIPYVVAKSGFWTGAAVIVTIGLSLMIVNLYLGEIVLRTKGTHQLTGYAKKYLGKYGKILMTVSMVLGIYGAMIAYLIGEGEALKAIFGGSEILLSLIFFVIVATIIFFGLKAVERSELLIVSLLLAVVIVISVFSFGNINRANHAAFNISTFFIPYGVILFAFIGTTAIPDVKRELTKNRKSIKKAIIIGSTIPIIMYLIFTFVVVGVIGGGFENLASNERVATVALSFFVSKNVAIFANLFAVFAMLTSFVALGFALKEMFHYDYKLSKKLSWMLTCAVPLIFFLLNSFVLNMAGFISVLGFTGAIAGGLAGILIVLMHRRAHKLGERKPEYLTNERGIISTVLVAIFLLGIAYEVLSIFGVISF